MKEMTDQTHSQNAASTCGNEAFSATCTRDDCDWPTDPCVAAALVVKDEFRPLASWVFKRTRRGRWYPAWLPLGTKTERVPEVVAGAAAVREHVESARDFVLTIIEHDLAAPEYPVCPTCAGSVNDALRELDDALALLPEETS